MSRLLFAGIATLALTAVSLAATSAQTEPARPKPGQWEVTGDGGLGITMEMCVDQAFATGAEALRSAAENPQNCTRADRRPIPGGYATELACTSSEGTITHASITITGDLQSQYRTDTSMRTGAGLEIKIGTTSRWLGPCPAYLKPGQTVTKTEMEVLAAAADRDARQPATAGLIKDADAAHDRHDYATTLRIIRPLADQGDPSAQTFLGRMYQWGEGVPQDWPAAVSWYRKAADQGYASGEVHLASMYGWGQGAPQDYTAAAGWYRRAAEQGYADGEVDLGSAYQLGQGVAQDYAAAIAWYRKATDQGSAYGEYSLGQMYERGLGVTRDYATAVSWYRKAADGGDASAPFTLGLIYGSDHPGLPQNYVQAYMWFSIAARSQAIAGRQRDLVAAEMTPEQIAQAQRLARAWTPK